MNLLFVSTVSSWGGSEILWSLMAEEAVKRGHLVQAVVGGLMKEDSNIKRLERAGARVHYRKDRFVSAVASKIRFTASKKFPRFWGHYTNINFTAIDSVIVSQGGTYEFCHDTDLLDRIRKYEINFYLISQYHNELGRLDPLLYKKAREIFPLARTIYFVSERNKMMCEIFLSKKLNNAKVINNPLRLRRSEPLSYPQSDEASFACVARLDVGVKCQNLLLQVLSLEKWKLRQWKLDFFGTGPDQEYLQALADNLGLLERINFRGHVDDVESIWKDHHLLLLPSAGEGCALSLIEAFECGRTAVVTDVGGHENLIVDGETGFLASSFSIKNFDDALEKAWAAKEQWPEIGTKGFEHLKRVFDSSIEKSLVDEITN